MPAYSSSAPGKIILFGEHAVVYGRPAIAVPVLKVRAKTIASADPRGTPGVVKLKAPDIGLDSTLADLPEEHPLAAAIWKAASTMKLSHIPACTIQVTSTIPIAGGMGSSAAVSVSILRAFSALMGHPLSDEQVSALAYEVEVLHHGTPSGIDNTVITYARPVYFIKGKEPEVLQVNQPFTLVIGDSGVQSSTSAMVGGVRQRHAEEFEKYETIFDAIGDVTHAAREAIEAGRMDALGPLMNENQVHLTRIGVSSPQLDSLVDVARSSGASGAKLSGAGGGGNIIALVTDETAGTVSEALQKAGAVRTIITEVHP